MKYIAGAIFMMLVFDLWMYTRFIPQSENLEAKLIQCQTEKHQIASAYTRYINKLTEGKR